MNLKIAARYPSGACSYYRTYGVLPHLTKLRPDIHVEPIDKIDWSYLSGADVLFLERPQDAEYLAACKIAKNFGVKLWIDYDDDLFNLPDYNPFHGFYGKKEVRESIIKALDMADVVTVATPAIADSYKKYAKTIHVIPNAFNNYSYSLSESPSSNKILTWRGSVTHRGDLLPVTREIVKLSHDFHKKWYWSFIAKELWFLTDYMAPGSFFNADEMTLPSYFQFFKKTGPAILVFPLEVNQFNASKSNCAWIEGVFAGACCVAPPLPEYKRPGIENYSSAGEFYDKVKILIESPAKRAENFQASLDYINANLLLSDVNKKRIAVLEQLEVIDRFSGSEVVNAS